jgi:hypothetical protein
MKNEKFIQILFELLNNTKNDINKDKSILNLHIKLNENILNNFEKKLTPDIYQENPNNFLKNILRNDTNYLIDEEEKYYIIDQSIIKDILKIIFNIFKANKFNFLNDLSEINNNEFISTYSQKQKKLGLKKLLQIEYIRSLLDLLINSYASNIHKKEVLSIISILNDINIFWTLHKIFFEFPFCNIIQISYSQIIDIITNIYTPDSLVKNFLLDKNNISLTSYITQHILEKSIFVYNSKRTALNPCVIYEFSILNQLMDCPNDVVQSINEKDKNLNVFNAVISDDLNKIIKTKLLYDENGSGEAPPDTDGIDRHKKIIDIIEDGKKIYEIYKKGGDYKKALKKRKEDKNDEKENDRILIETDKKEKSIKKEDFEIIEKPMLEIKKIDDNIEEKEKEEEEEEEEEINDINNKNEIIYNNSETSNNCNYLDYWNAGYTLTENDIITILDELH